MIRLPPAARLRPVGGPLFLLALCCCAHFARSGRFGFYEDDHYFAAATMTWSPADLWAWVRTQFAWFPFPQGRPVGFALGGLLPYVGYHLGGVRGMYAVGFAVVGVNGVLFYALLRRCLAPPMPMVAAVAFVLFPADTTRPFLCHAHILFPAVTFALVAAHLYLSDSVAARVGCYAMVVVVLLTYETAVLPLVPLPLLRRARWDRRWAAGGVVHVAMVLAISAGLFGVRRHLGERRATEASAAVVAADVITGTGIGNATVWSTLGWRAVQGWYDVHDRRRWVAVVAPVIAAAVWLTVPRRRAGPADHAALAADCRRAAAYAVAASAVAYVFCFAPPHYPPDFVEGRLTSTHLAAAWPACIAIGVIATVPILMVQTLGVRPWAAAVAVSAVAGGYFAALFAVALDEQDGYAAIWQARRHFWSQVLRLSPDLTDHTIVVCDGLISPPAYYLGCNSWSDYLVLTQCYQWPHGGHFRRDPMLFAYPAGTWPDAVAAADAPPPPEQGNLILLHVDGENRVSRQTGTVVLQGRPFPLRSPPAEPATRAAYPTRPMYHLLGGGPG